MVGIVIIGAGECGVRAAFELRAKGYEGSVTLVNGESSLPYERPPLSKSLEADPKAIRNGDAYSEADIDMRNGTVAQYIDPSHKTVSLSDGTSLAYEKLLIASGARARVFSGMEDCLTLRTDKDCAIILRHLKPGMRIGIIGGGFIGLELAATAVKAGADVTVIEGAQRLLQRAVPEGIAEVVHRRHEAEGVTILGETGVASANANSITVADGSTLSFDIVVAGVGALPNTELAHKSGLFVTNGIEVDQNFLTSDPNIYAGGDCCNFVWNHERVRLESWKAAQDQGAPIAAAMMSEEVEYAAVPWFWSDQYDLKLQIAGLNQGYDQVVVRGDPESRKFAAFYLKSEKLIAVDAVNSAPEFIVAKKLIIAGASIAPDVLSNTSTSMKEIAAMAAA